MDWIKVQLDQRSHSQRFAAKARDEEKHRQSTSAPRDDPGISDADYRTATNSQKCT
jgi:hypothetical protein